MPKGSDAETAWVRKTLLVALIICAVGLAAIPLSSKNTKSLHLNLESVTTPKQQAIGLSGRESLGKDDAMLFVFNEPRVVCMWMKDMKFNIDIVWLNESKKITKIEKNLSPNTYPQSFCASNSKYVIEMNAGTADQQNLELDQQLSF